ncbi:hypothetical protein [Rhizobium sp. 2MFCol3.1]|uniref:hypothetical protein n=1 Tax=Rhizobium sp. 2MFCol3.1 TaxID=1246459 RepID=UPI0003757E8E|nr:hypothetical protein [Rhizobium sp. 2MFCol3.1]
MTNECKPLVEVSIQRDGRWIPLGIMNVAQALELPHHRDYVFVHLAGKADGSFGGLPQSR